MIEFWVVCFEIYATGGGVVFRLILLVLATFKFTAHTFSPVEIVAEMSEDEKIGQLFMVAGYVDADFASKEASIENAPVYLQQLIHEFHIGAIAFVGPSDFESQIAITNLCQKESKYPLLIAQDLEWGLSMRLKDGPRFPKNITLGELHSDELIYAMGKEIGRQAKLIGVHINLSPVLDVNTEPNNIAINERSFGKNPQLVAQKGARMIKGLQAAGVIASAKHFPGLGDIKIDPHLGLPTITHNVDRLSSVELLPFEAAIASLVKSIQTEHVIVPALEKDNSLPASLSYAVVTDLLKGKFNFQGLIISGALRMKALTENFSNEEIAVKAFLAGHDMLLMPQELKVAFNAIKAALRSGQITQSELDARVLKIISLKEEAGLFKSRYTKPIKASDLYSEDAKQIKQDIFASLCGFKRDQGVRPPIDKSSKVAFIQIGELIPNLALAEMKNYYPQLDYYSFVTGQKAELETLNFEKYDFVLFSARPDDPRKIAAIRLLSENQSEALKNFRVDGISPLYKDVITELLKIENRVVLVYFGSSFGLPHFHKFGTIYRAYEDDEVAQQLFVDDFLKGRLSAHL